MLDEFIKANYSAAVTTGVDVLTVRKHNQSAWIHLEMDVNGKYDRITIRDPHQAQLLVTMLNQILLPIK